jgi:hypothetical protein
MNHPNACAIFVAHTLARWRNHRYIAQLRQRRYLLGIEDPAHRFRGIGKQVGHEQQSHTASHRHISS